jgi:hypothetical protein
MSARVLCHVEMCLTGTPPLTENPFIDAERSHMAETDSEAHDLFPRFSQEKSAAMVHAPGLLHIGGSAYFVWADTTNSA